MKRKTCKALGLLLAVLMVVSLLPAAALAADDDPIAAAPEAGETADTIDIFVTVANAGEVVVPMGKVTVQDLDASGAIDVNEALYAAHEAFFEGGAAAGYATATSDWGLSVAKLWGEETASVGYYNNNAMCWGLTDPVAEGDHLYAFVYADKTAVSDAYAYLDKYDYTAVTQEGLDVTLMAAVGFDENWNPVFAPFSGAAISAYAAETLEKLSDDAWSVSEGEGGVYTLTFKEAGSYLIVAENAEANIVPAVAAVNVYNSIEAYVTISDKGEVKVPLQLVTVKDLDNSGVFDVNEVLIAAHDEFFEGGAEAGYATASTDWGLSVAKLWGEETASVGYYNNNAMCWGLTDAVAPYDTICAFVYADETYYSDAYAYFDRFEYTKISGISFNATLMAAAGFDENWNPVFAPFNGAEITAYYADTFEKVPADKWFAFGDDNGVYQITFKEIGKYIIVGEKPDAYLVPAVASVEVFDHDCPCEKFTDFEAEAWYHEAVDYAVGHKLMNGTSTTTFEPATETSRAMIVTMLYRLEESPEVSSANPFTDVEDGQWYTDAIKWAAANGVVEGRGDGTFAPTDKVTREQLATILYRYAKYKGIDVSAAADLSGYADAGEISSWALAGVQWANAKGLVTGRTISTLVPGGNASRAETAAVFMRFLENI